MEYIVRKSPGDRFGFFRNREIEQFPESNHDRSPLFGADPVFFYTKQIAPHSQKIQKRPKSHGKKQKATQRQRGDHTGTATPLQF